MIGASDIDALLPQTQCTRCGYTGCLPYAEAIARGEADINQCPPGGTETIVALAALTGRPAIATQPRQRPRSRAHRGVHRRRTLHRLHQVPAALPGGCDHRRAAPHAHRHRRAVHGLRAVRGALPGRLHHHDPAAGEPVAVAHAAARAGLACSLRRAQRTCGASRRASRRDARGQEAWRAASAVKRAP